MEEGDVVCDKCKRLFQKKNGYCQFCGLFLDNKFLNNSYYLCFSCKKKILVISKFCPYCGVEQRRLDILALLSNKKSILKIIKIKND